MLKTACCLKLTLGGRGATADVQMSSNFTDCIHKHGYVYSVCIRYEEHTAST